MTPKEEASFRTLYATWPTARLARASTLEKCDYQPEAVALLLDELNKRGIAEGALLDIVASTPPQLQGTLPERNTWLLPARLTRRKYIIRTIGFLATVVVVTFALELVPAAQPASFVILALASLIYGAIGLLLPRSKDAGFSSWLAVLFALIPITAFFTFVILLFAPSKK